MRIFVLGNGSSGNCLLVEADGERLLVDAGIGPTRAAERMRGLGADLVTQRPPLGVLVTHEHGDHSAHALPLARALRAPVLSHAGVVRATSRVEVQTFTPGRTFALGPFVVESLLVPHDAVQVALRISAGDRRFGLATDLGEVTRELGAFLRGCDLVFLESNYCPRLLDEGPYPPQLKRRIGGRLGHLANEQAAELARSLEDSRVSRLVLLHLSRVSNTPQRAREVVGSRTRRLIPEVLGHGESRRFDRVEAGSHPYVEQLAFAFR